MHALDVGDRREYRSVDNNAAKLDKVRCDVAGALVELARNIRRGGSAKVITVLGKYSLVIVTSQCDLHSVEVASRRVLSNVAPSCLVRPFAVLVAVAAHQVEECATQLTSRGAHLALIDVRARVRAHHAAVGHAILVAVGAHRLKRAVASLRCVAQADVGAAWVGARVVAVRAVAVAWASRACVRTECAAVEDAPVVHLEAVGGRVVDRAELEIVRRADLRAVDAVPVALRTRHNIEALLLRLAAAAFRCALGGDSETVARLWANTSELVADVLAHAMVPSARRVLVAAAHRERVLALEAARAAVEDAVRSGAALVRVEGATVREACGHIDALVARAILGDELGAVNLASAAKARRVTVSCRSAGVADEVLALVGALRLVSAQGAVVARALGDAVAAALVNARSIHHLTSGRALSRAVERAVELAARVVEPAAPRRLGSIKALAFRRRERAIAGANGVVLRDAAGAAAIRTHAAAAQTALPLELVP